MASAGAPESGPDGQTAIGAFFGFAVAVGIVVGASLAGVLTGGVAVAVVGVLAATGAFVGFGLGKALSDELSHDVVVSDLDLNNCFARGTLVQLPDGLKPIEKILPGDIVMAFDKFQRLTPRKVARLFHNVTDRWQQRGRLAAVARIMAIAAPVFSPAQAL